MDNEAIDRGINQIETWFLREGQDPNFDWNEILCMLQDIFRSMKEPDATQEFKEWKDKERELEQEEPDPIKEVWDTYEGLIRKYCLSNNCIEADMCTYWSFREFVRDMGKAIKKYCEEK